MHEDGEAEVQSRLSLEEIQAGLDCGNEEDNFDMDMGHHAECTPSTPFASSEAQVSAQHRLLLNGCY